jgi:type IV pilus assembly protein PilA
MSKLIRKSNKGFTLIELMIVVAIIGILAAIAIPNFLRFQLKAKSSEGKVNIAAIRTAEESYLAEFGVYVAAALAPVALPVNKVPFVEADPTLPASFNTLGWQPEGQVFFQYAVNVNAAAPSASYTASATANIDGTGVNQAWGYVKEIGTTNAGFASIDPDAFCALTGVWDAAAGTATALDTVGPCNATSGQSDF